GWRYQLRVQGGAWERGAPVPIMRAMRPRSSSSVTQPPRGAGGDAPGAVSPIVVLRARASICPAQTRHDPDTGPGTNAGDPPTQGAITASSVVHYTPEWFGRREHSIHMAHVASVEIDTNLFFSNVVIETSGGSEPVRCHGHRKRDAVEMKRLINQYQSAYYGDKKNV